MDLAGKALKVIVVLGALIKTSPSYSASIDIDKLPKKLVGDWTIIDIVITTSSFSSIIGGSSKSEYETVKKNIQGKTLHFGEQTFAAIDEAYCAADGNVMNWTVDDGEDSTVFLAEEMRKFHRNARSGSYKTDHAIVFVACSGQDAPTFDDAVKLKAYSPRCIKKRELFRFKISKDLIWGDFIVLDENSIVMDSDDWYICLKKQ